MYRVTKALNHNAVLAIMDKSSREYLLLGKGIGFGRKVSEYIEPTEDCRIYSLSSDSERGSARELLREIDPKYLEIADAILDSAKQEFGKSIKLPLWQENCWRRQTGFCWMKMRSAISRFMYIRPSVMRKCPVRCRSRRRCGNVFP